MSPDALGRDFIELLDCACARPQWQPQSGLAPDRADARRGCPAADRGARAGAHPTRGRGAAPAGAASTRLGAKVAHARFVDDYDHQPHWAFRHRTHNRHSPAEVLGWTDVQRLRTRAELHRIFYSTRFLCRLDRAHFRRWKLYGEETLARHLAVIWLHGEALTIEHAETPLTKYGVQYQPDKKHFRDVPAAERLQTPYRPPQGPLWEVDETIWKLATRLPDYAPRKR
jgi:hypothetical protein